MLVYALNILLYLCMDNVGFFPPELFYFFSVKQLLALEILLHFLWSKHQINLPAFSFIYWPTNGFRNVTITIGLCVAPIRLYYTIGKYILKYFAYLIN